MWAPFPPEDVYAGILKEILKVRVKRQIGRSNPRVVKTRDRKYEVLSKHKRESGMFGYRQNLQKAPAPVLKKKTVPVYA